MTFKNCCFFVNLRLGTIIIALICAVAEFISMLTNLSALWYIQDSDHESGYIYLLRFILFVFLLFACLKLALCASLYVGLLERRPDHLEIWYKGYIFLEILYIALLILRATNEAVTESVLFWLILGLNLLLTLATFYFILVVRSYHHEMCRQPNFYQDYSYQQPSKSYCEKPKDANGEIVLFSAPISTKEKGLTPNFIQKGGGTVYATPASSQIYPSMPVMPLFSLNNEKSPSVDVHAIEKERRRRSSCTKGLIVGFDNHIELEE